MCAICLANRHVNSQAYAAAKRAGAVTGIDEGMKMNDLIWPTKCHVNIKCSTVYFFLQEI